MALALLCCVPAAAAAQEQYVFKIISRGILDKKEALIQTGFRLRGTKGIITALHGVAGARKITAINRDALAFYDLTIKSVDVDKDLALLSSEELEREAAEGLEEAADASVNANQLLSIWGHPQGIQFRKLERFEAANPAYTLLSARIPDASSKPFADRKSPLTKITILDVSISLAKGVSGAPVLDSRNRVVGVANGGLHGGVPVGWAIPAPLKVSQWASAAEARGRLNALAGLDTAGLFNDLLTENPFMRAPSPEAVGELPQKWFRGLVELSRAAAGGKDVPPERLAEFFDLSSASKHLNEQLVKDTKSFQELGAKLDRLMQMGRPTPLGPPVNFKPQGLKREGIHNVSPTAIYFAFPILVTGPRRESMLRSGKPDWFLDKDPLVFPAGGKYRLLTDDFEDEYYRSFPSLGDRPYEFRIIWELLFDEDGKLDDVFRFQRDWETQSDRTDPEVKPWVPPHRAAAGLRRLSSDEELKAKESELQKKRMELVKEWFWGLVELSRAAAREGKDVPAERLKDFLDLSTASERLRNRMAKEARSFQELGARFDRLMEAGRPARVGAPTRFSEETWGGGVLGRFRVAPLGIDFRSTVYLDMKALTKTGQGINLPSRTRGSLDPRLLEGNYLLVSGKNEKLPKGDFRPVSFHWLVFFDSDGKIYDLKTDLEATAWL